MIGKLFQMPVYISLKIQYLMCAHDLYTVNMILKEEKLEREAWAL
jgi:hypothetical protein